MQARTCLQDRHVGTYTRTRFRLASVAATGGGDPRHAKRIEQADKSATVSPGQAYSYLQKIETPVIIVQLRHFAEEVLVVHRVTR